MNEREELIAAYDEYIALFGKSEASVLGIAHVHGYRCPDEFVQRGKELREKIASLKSSVPAQGGGHWGELRQALDAIQAQCDDMRSLKGWRLNLIRENLAKAYAALASPAQSSWQPSADEAYALFLILDTLARSFRGDYDAVNYFRDKLLPAYRDWHAANPGKVHPSLPLSSTEGK